MTVDTANFRAGPGTDFALAGVVTTGQTLAIVGRDATGNWLQLAEGSWIFTDLVAAAGEPSATPTAMPPTPTVSLLYTAPGQANNGRWSTPPASTYVPHHARRRRSWVGSRRARASRWWGCSRRGCRCG